MQKLQKTVFFCKLNTVEFPQSMACHPLFRVEEAGRRSVRGGNKERKKHIE